MRNSKVIISKNIKMDRDYKSVLNYSEEDMITLMTDSNNLVYTALDFSFLRENRNGIYVEIPYGTALQGNYLAFQNPDYSNKWFFAFIDDVVYLNDKTTIINFTVDIFTTWWKYWYPKACFVIREHVLDDTIGLHTQQENLETGEYIVNEVNTDTTQLTDYCYVVGSTTYPNMSKAEDSLAGCGEYNGIFSGVKYFRYDTVSALDIVLELWNKAGKGDSITGIFLTPKWLAPLGSELDNEGNSQRVVQQTQATNNYTYTVTKNYSINGYSPVNNKLKCYPYNYLMVTNNNGGNSIYRYELFSSSNCVFNVAGALTPGCSIICSPKGYKRSVTTDINYSESISAGKFPICNYANDMYVNWMTQQSVNNNYNMLKSVTSGGISGAVTGGTIGSMIAPGPGTVIGGIIGGIIGASSNSFGTAWEQMREKENHQFIPPQAEGNLNCGDVITSLGINTFSYYKMSIRQEYATIIDKFFTRYGYATNEFKIPNMTHRQNYNYVEIGTSESLCYCNNYNNLMIPAKDLENINKIFRNGVTIWNNHTNLGDYSVSNNITQ